MRDTENTGGFINTIVNKVREIIEREESLDDSAD